MIVKPSIPFNAPLKYRLVRQLYFSGVASCNDLSEALGKSLPHIAKSLYELIDEGFFREPQELGSVCAVLKQKGHFYPVTTLSPLMLRLVRRKALRRIKENKRWTYVG